MRILTVIIFLRLFGKRVSVNYHLTINNDFVIYFISINELIKNHVNLRYFLLHENAIREKYQ